MSSVQDSLEEKMEPLRLVQPNSFTFLKTERVKSVSLLPKENNDISGKETHKK
jgi:hypothetical protein